MRGCGRLHWILRSISACAALSLVDNSRPLRTRCHGKFHGRGEGSLGRVDSRCCSEGAERRFRPGVAKRHQRVGHLLRGRASSRPVHPRSGGAGFKRLVTNSITLEVNQSARVDLTLEVGAAAETIEVKDLAPAAPDREHAAGPRGLRQHHREPSAQRPQFRPAHAALSRRGHLRHGHVYQRDRRPAARQR